MPWPVGAFASAENAAVPLEGERGALVASRRPSPLGRCADPMEGAKGALRPWKHYCFCATGRWPGHPTNIESAA